MLVLHTRRCHTYILLYACPLHSYMHVLYTLICRSVIPLYAGPLYSYKSVLHTLIWRPYIVLYTSPLYSNILVLYVLICQSYLCRCYMLVFTNTRIPPPEKWVYTQISSGKSSIYQIFLRRKIGIYPVFPPLKIWYAYTHTNFSPKLVFLPYEFKVLQHQHASDH